MQTKLLIATVSSIGTIGGASAGFAYWYSHSIDLKQDLINKSLTPLSKSKVDDQGIWVDLAKKYSKEKNTKKLGKLSFELQTNRELKDGDLTKFQDACEALFKKRAREKDYSEALQLAKDWCIKESTKLFSSGLVATLVSGSDSVPTPTV